jgi:hypothetical protein
MGSQLRHPLRTVTAGSIMTRERLDEEYPARVIVEAVIVTVIP